MMTSKPHPPTNVLLTTRTYIIAAECPELKDTTFQISENAMPSYQYTDIIVEVKGRIGIIKVSRWMNIR